MSHVNAILNIHLCIIFVAISTRMIMAINSAYTVTVTLLLTTRITSARYMKEKNRYEPNVNLCNKHKAVLLAPHPSDVTGAYINFLIKQINFTHLNYNVAIWFTAFLIIIFLYMKGLLANAAVFTNREIHIGISISPDSSICLTGKARRR